MTKGSKLRALVIVCSLFWLLAMASQASDIITTGELERRLNRIEQTNFEGRLTKLETIAEANSKLLWGLAVPVCLLGFDAVIRIVAARKSAT